MSFRVRLLCVLFLFTFAGTALSQKIYTPVKWETTYQHAGGEEYDLIFSATLDPEWSIYSQYLESEDGPVPTSFEFETGSHFALKGKTQEKGNKVEGYDQYFDMNLTKFFDEAVFTQRIVVKDHSQPIKGYYEYMVCDKTKCLPPEFVDFEFSIPQPAAGGKEKNDETPATESDIKPAGKAAQKESTGAAKSSPVEEAEEEASLPEVQEQPSNTPTSGIAHPVQWSIRTESKGETEHAIVVEAEIEKGWNIYSQKLEDDGPIPTSFYFDDVAGYKLTGDPVEKGEKIIREFDPFFKMELVKLKERVSFTQLVQTNAPTAPLTGEIEYMVCDATKCLPPQYLPFKVDLVNKVALIGEEAESAGREAESNPVVGGGFDTPFPQLETVNTSDPVQQCGTYENDKKSLWSIFVLGLLGGFIALLTPCVFPMIPLTVSFFTKGNKSKSKGLRDASFYGFSIFAVYLLLSVPFHLMDSIDPNILNNISTNVWLNILFFAIFLFFAFSFFGYYELTLPSSWTNRASSAEGLGGIAGIFFMAVTLALVSFSCTGPILGSLLAGTLSSDGGAMQLTSGMAGFGLALALPFALFAAFPNWLKSLPKSGGWLNTVKVVLGFVELALALKFLSNADLVKHWGLLKIEVFLGLWILIALGLALYLFGKIKFPHDSPVTRLSFSRAVLGLASVAFALYMATGFIYNDKIGSLRPLKLLSGLAPPVCYSWVYPCDCPQGLPCFKDFSKGMAYAQEVNKPIMIDFTGHACVNCRKMEEHVWPIQEVYQHLNNDYVLISLYVDEKLPLPEGEQAVWPRRTTGGEMKFRFTGQKWQYLQTEYFGNNSQPWYVLLAPDGHLLAQPRGYTPEWQEYAAFLQCGLQGFEAYKEEQSALGAR